MFRHQGKSRTQAHNLRIASVLSFVAGIVNVTGFLSIQRLTTNVTGHFAYFINDVSKMQFTDGFVYFLYILAFLSGSIVSGILIELVSRTKKLNIFVLPTVLESGLLIAVAVFSQSDIALSNNTIAYLMLFAMGLQNSFVTKISNAIVRTTHLTGLFTDLGLEIAQLIFERSKNQQRHLKSTIKLRLYIISFFFTGGTLAGLLHPQLKFGLLYVAAATLLIGLISDDLRFRMIVLKRNYRKS